MISFVPPRVLSLNGLEVPVDFPYLSAIIQGPPKYDCDFYLKHPKMEPGKRAKIFAPFDALDGYSDAVRRKDVQYVPRAELSEDECEELNEALKKLRDLTFHHENARRNRVMVSVTFFTPCEDENSFSFGLRGIYETISGVCWNVDFVGKTMTVAETVVPLDCVKRIEWGAGHSEAEAETDQTMG